MEASEILFGKGTTETLSKLPVYMLLSIFEGVPQYEIAKSKIEKPIPIIEFLTEYTGIFPSKGEVRRLLKDNGVSVNKEKVTEAFTIDASNLLQDAYILVQKGKKSYFLVKAI